MSDIQTPVLSTDVIHRGDCIEVLKSLPDASVDMDEEDVDEDDLQEDFEDDVVAEALKALHRRCADVRYLGSWPTGAAAGAVPPAVEETREASEWLSALKQGKRQGVRS